MELSFLISRQPLFVRFGFAAVACFGWAINYIQFNNRYGIEIHVKRHYLTTFVTLLKHHFFFRFKTVCDIVGLDYPQLTQRFRVLYLFLSYQYTLRCCVAVATNETIPLDTLTSLYPGCGWLEREVWDFFGIYFQGNRDLRRLLTDYGFLGFPLRKDFPLTGFSEVLYEDRRAQVVSRNVSLAQEYRDFSHQNPWRQLIK